MRRLVAAALALCAAGFAPGLAAEPGPGGPPAAVRTLPVSFESQGRKLSGTLYLPARAQGPLPGVVVTGAWLTVKEQMAGRYAGEMAARGFAALAFDFRGWGASAGSPRSMEDPGAKTQDILAALDFLAARPEVDPGRVAGLGICASAGYMARAALDSPRMRALALVAPWLHDADIVEQVYGGKKGVAELIALGRKAAESQKAGRPMLIPAASATDKTALMFRVPYYTEPGRGLIAQWDNLFNLASWEPWLTYDALASADALSKPTLLVHSEAAAIPQGARRFLERMGGRAQARWLKDVTQFDFYDRPGPVTQASDAVARHLAAAMP